MSEQIQGTGIWYCIQMNSMMFILLLLMDEQTVYWLIQDKLSAECCSSMHRRKIDKVSTEHENNEHEIYIQNQAKMSDNNINNIFPDLDSFNNQSVLSFNFNNPSIHAIETNRILPGILTMNGIDVKFGPPPIKQSEEDSLAANLKADHANNEWFQSDSYKKKKDGCTCKKTQCLKMYCDCFLNERACTQACQCCNCCNDDINSTLVLQAREEIKNKKGRNKSMAGCNCKKTQCLKKYCECFNSGGKCSSSCKCLNCMNMDPEKQQQEKEEELGNRNQQEEVEKEGEEEEEEGNQKVKTFSEPRQAMDFSSAGVGANSEADGVKAE